MRRRFFSKIINKASSIPSTIDINNYMTIEAMEDGVVVQFPSELNYSVDAAINWSTLAANTPVTINSGQTISFKANLTPVADTGSGTFTITGGACRLLGNCMSLLFGDNAATSVDLSAHNSAFMELFLNCTTIVSVAENFLPATTLSSRCYQSIFSGCTSLTDMPILSAETLISYCYKFMFLGCSSLTTAKSIGATTMGSQCCESMFQNCKSLVTAPTLNSVTSTADYSYYRMFLGCTKLTSAPKVTAITLGTYACAEMFKNCTSLVTAPSISATTVGTYSCYYMFQGCTKLTTPPSTLPANKLASRCYARMFYNCTAMTKAPTLPATTLDTYCYEYMFYNCKKLAKAPTLPATTLTNYCYRYMFYNCAALTAIPTLPATTMTSNCYRQMFRGCTSLTTVSFPNTKITGATYCHCEMFYDCTNLVSVTCPNIATLPTYGFQKMFYGCTKLNNIKMLSTNISATKCLDNWVSGVASTGKFVKYASMTNLPTGVSGIPSGWTVKNLIESYWITLGGKKTFYAEEGMTWEEWVNSKYNIFGLSFVDGQLTEDRLSKLIDDNGEINENTVIKENYTYNIGPFEFEW